MYDTICSMRPSEEVQKGQQQFCTLRLWKGRQRPADDRDLPVRMDGRKECGAKCTIHVFLPSLTYISIASNCFNYSSCCGRLLLLFELLLLLLLQLRLLQPLQVKATLLERERERERERPLFLRKAAAQRRKVNF